MKTISGFCCFHATQGRQFCITMIAVPKSLPQIEPARGAVYRDLDGELVRLVEVRRNLCTWIPVTATETTRQVTHRDNFVRRFKPLRERVALNNPHEKLAA